MPMSRYEIRNEFSLADRELYQAADKDDPEALLEGFSMASLVGVLRQLGDLAQFATEVFSDLHDEVAATAARGHGLMVRVQQLEMELPLIEKAFLKETYHASFFYSAGMSWHPKLHTDQNCITKRDSPRFIMDSYEEARGPPRLFLLDKFDVGGAGACLKRYTNPSLYKVEAIALGTTNSVEKKSRKGKRRGTHRRNERAPRAFPTPHSKLHQLLLEEKIEDNASDPACHVKLKRRLNGFPLHMKTAESYMEKILKDSSPDHKFLKKVFTGQLANDIEAEVGSHYNGSEGPDLELTNKNPVASDLEAEVGSHYNGSESPGTGSTSKTPSPKLEMENVFSNIFSCELDFMTSDGRHYDSPKGKLIFGARNSSSNLHEDVGEKKIIVDRESKEKTNVVGYRPGDVTSEVEIFIDTRSSYPQTDSNPKLKAMIDFHVSSNRKQVPDLDVTKSLHQAHFPDCQSMGSSTLSDDGISSLKKCISTSSSSDGVSEIAGSTHLESEVSNAHLFNEIFQAKNSSTPLKWRGFDAGCNDVADNSTLSSDNSELTVSNGIPAQRHEDKTSGDQGILKVQRGGLVAQGLLGAEASNTTESEIKLEDNAPFSSDTYTSPLQWGHGCSFGGFASNHSLASVQDKHPNMPESSTCNENSGSFREFTSITHLGERGAAYRGSTHLVNLNDADVERDETDLSRWEIETGVSESGNENLVPKSHLKQKGDSNHLDLEEYRSISLPTVENHKGQGSCFDLLTQGNDTITDVGTGNEPLGSISSNLLPEAAKSNLEEVPPLPPLPPVQWRNECNQSISLANENEALSDNEGPSSSHSMTNQKTPRQVFMGEDLPLVHESTSGNPFHDGPFSSLVNYILLNEGHLRSQNLSPPGNKTNTPSLGEIESITQKLPLAENLDEMSQQDDHIRPNSNTIFNATSADVSAAGDTGQVHNLEAMIQQKESSVTRSKDNLSVQCSPNAEGSASTIEGDAAPLKTENEQPKVMKLFPQGESTWQSDAEEKPSDVQAMKLPRLRIPLVDAIAAHDNTKLKKVKDRTGPKIQMSDGRDSLLEQIRAKSFNLKPTVVRRHSFQGPTTNLRVAAILEKAKTIRHAFAGSDGDDDSWSD